MRSQVAALIFSRKNPSLPSKHKDKTNTLFIKLNFDEKKRKRIYSLLSTANNRDRTSKSNNIWQKN